MRVVPGVKGTSSPNSFKETKSSGRVTREINNSLFWNVTLAQCTWILGYFWGEKGSVDTLHFNFIILFRI